MTLREQKILTSLNNIILAYIVGIDANQSKPDNRFEPEYKDAWGAFWKQIFQSINL